MLFELMMIHLSGKLNSHGPNSEASKAATPPKYLIWVNDPGRSNDKINLEGNHVNTFSDYVVHQFSPIIKKIM